LSGFAVGSSPVPCPADTNTTFISYIYSLAWRVTNEDYTIQRPLVMDWRTDLRVRDIGDHFMFGPALLVNPVLQSDANRRSLYLPDAPVWYDFWTGESRGGNREIDADAPLDRIPLCVRAGSILPLGPEIEYLDEKPAGPIELRIYPGADGELNLYQDAGDGYDYENGVHSVIPMHWSESNRTLTIGQREREYPGMPASSRRRHNSWPAGKDAACLLNFGG
jgi:alpha-D-xyloside xylohydrolase